MRELWQALATEFRRRKAARTGTGVRDVLVDYKALLSTAGCDDADKNMLAEQALREAHREGWLTLETHRRDTSLPVQVRLPLANEAILFTKLGEASPTARREAVAQQFEVVAESELPESWREAWRSWCMEKAVAARNGGALAPFDREDVACNQELLALLPRLLSWSGESLIRFASCVLCGDSKRLAQLSGSAARALTEISGGRISSLEEVGILETPRSVLVHGPLRLQLDGQWIDLSALRGPFRISGIDIERAEEVTTTSSRCLTIENETTFHEVAKLGSGELLVQTSYAGSATLALLRRLPAAIECWHFGDTDLEGFDVLRDLRQRLGRVVRPMHMNFRPAATGQSISANEKRLLRRLLDAEALADVHPVLREIERAQSLGECEQESLGRPDLPCWPFYGPPTKGGSR